jgi:Sap, sulfolipid-1-addressing protein
VTVQIVLLALASGLRPSSFVAVYTLVRDRSPSRLMTAYVAAGLAFTFAVALVVLLVFSGIDLRAGTSRTRAIAEIAAGAFTLALGTAVALRRGPSWRSVDASGGANRLRSGLQGRQITTRTAALAGAVTHIPGLLYLLALDLIVSQEPDVPRELVQVGIYNAVWFALPILALAVCIVDPAAARAGLQMLERRVSTHARTIVIIIAFAVGSWLLIDGATTI